MKISCYTVYRSALLFFHFSNATCIRTNPDSTLCHFSLLSAEENRPQLCGQGLLYAVVNAFEVCPRSEWVVFTGAQVVQNISGTGENTCMHSSTVCVCVCVCVHVCV